MTSHIDQVKMMPVYKKPSHGKIHLYGGHGEDQPYIGPIDDPQKWDVKVASETQKRDDDIFDKQFQKYVDNVLLLSLYMPEPERKEYLSKRTAELLARLRRLEGELQKTTITPISQVSTSGIGQIITHVATKPRSFFQQSRSFNAPSMKKITKELSKKKKKRKRKVKDSDK